MAVQFQFTLNDEDAENLMYFMQDAISLCHEGILEKMGTENGESYIAWYKSHIQYIEDMKTVILKNQKRVDDSKDFEI